MFANECAHAAAIVAGCSLDCDGACWTGLSLSVATVLLSWPGLERLAFEELGRPALREMPASCTLFTMLQG